MVQSFTHAKKKERSADKMVNASAEYRYARDPEETVSQTDDFNIIYTDTRWCFRGGKSHRHVGPRWIVSLLKERFTNSAGQTNTTERSVEHLPRPVKNTCSNKLQKQKQESREQATQNQ